MRTLVLVIAVALAGCGSDARSSSSLEASPEYEATGTVLEDRSHGPELCLGPVLTSDPIQCGGLPLVGWDWDAVEGEDDRHGTKTVGAHVRGRWDGMRFTLTAPPGPPRPIRQELLAGTYDFRPACDPPDGDSGAGDEGWEGTAVVQHPDLVAIWVSDPGGPWDGPFTGNVVVRPGAAAEITALVRGSYRGLLCVVERDLPTMRELDRIQARLGEVVDQLVWTSVPEYHRGVVMAEVTVADERARRAVEEAFGPGRVELIGALTPVDP